MIGVGIDAVDVNRFRDIAVRRERFVDRVFTSGERADMAGRRDQIPGLAARFAAKEATMKALRIADEAIPWNSISVVRDRFGRPTMALTGAAAALAGDRDVGELDVSLTHEGPLAVAVVIAQSGGAA